MEIGVPMTPSHSRKKQTNGLGGNVIFFLDFLGHGIRAKSKTWSTCLLILFGELSKRNECQLRRWLMECLVDKKKLFPIPNSQNEQSYSRKVKFSNIKTCDRSRKSLKGMENWVSDVMKILEKPWHITKIRIHQPGQGRLDHTHIKNGASWKKIICPQTAIQGPPFAKYLTIQWVFFKILSHYTSSHGSFSPDPGIPGSQM